jgi:hypothetical protein
MKSTHSFVTSMAEMALLNPEEMMAGYWAGIADAPEPDMEQSRAFHHGWRNGRVDGGHAKLDAAQASLLLDQFRQRNAQRS